MEQIRVIRAIRGPQFVVAVLGVASLRTSATVLTADAGYHSEANLAALATRNVPARIADPDMRKRDARFADRDHHTRAQNPLHDKSGATQQALPLFAPSEFTYDAAARTCVCLAGKSLFRASANNRTNGYVGEHLRGAKRDWAPCALRTQGLRTPDTTVAGNIACFRGHENAETETHTRRMQQRLDTPEGRDQYGRRFATVDALPPSSRCSRTCGTTRDSIASRCAAARK